MSSTRYQVMGFSLDNSHSNQPRPTPTPQEFNELVGFDGGYYIGSGTADGKNEFHYRHQFKNF